MDWGFGIALVLLLVAYLIGSIPFGVLVARWKGVDLFAVGSGNIGATNVARTLGRKLGILVFVLDAFKGVLPPVCIVPVAHLLHPQASTAIGSEVLLRVLAGMLALVGHLFPVFLRFRGGKGVATGAGIMAVLAPGPLAVGLTAWGIVTIASRYVSLGSFAAAVVLISTRFLTEPQPFSADEWPITISVLLAGLVVFVKHRANAKRLWNGRESRVSDGARRHLLLRAAHVLAMGVWFGGSLFFNYAVALPTFPWFKKIVNDGPSDRTAFQTIIAPDATVEQKNALASALAGSVVGPVFPRYFAMQAICAILAIATAWAWRVSNTERIHLWRLRLLAVAALAVVIGWPLSEYVSMLRVQRFDANPAVAQAARDAFGPWHLPSLFLSFITTVISGIVLLFAAKMPVDECETRSTLVDRS